jgi:hypothetical protein
MSSQTKYHGDLNPLANFDQRSYTVGSLNAVTSAATVQPQGPKLDFATITFTGHATGASVNAAITALTQLATVYLYEFTTGGTNDTLAVAFYPTAAWGDVTATGAGTLDQAVTDAVGSAVSVAASVTFTG